MDDQGDIGVLTSHCVRGFDELVKSLAICPEELHEHMSPRAVDTDFARFKIWCGIEITTGSRTSWEELKQSSDASTEEGRMDKYGDFNTEDSDEESDTSDENNSELAERQSEIQDTITHLYRLSFKMRSASHRSLSIRALSIKVVDPETGEDLFSGYAGFDYQYVLESLQQLRQVPQSLTLDLQPVQRVNDIPAFLLERLSRAITNRRRYFAYWQRHALKLSRIVDEPVVPQKSSVTSKEIKHEEPLVRLTTQPHDKDWLKLLPNRANLMPISGPKTVISGTDISKYQSNLDDQLDTQTVISYATTARDIEGNSADLPPPPADASFKPEFVCPYCWVACPSQQGKGKSWR
ncbi:MAG: Checkpoint kinase 2 [Geoglossum simile]|nr:MAG: Checkpoint kinase 2 [Geoglossum simile]